MKTASMKIVAALAESDCKHLISADITTCLGAVVLANEAQWAGVNSIVVNGEVSKHERTIQLIDEEIGSSEESFLFLTCTAGNVRHTRELALRYSKQGVRVVLGGPNVSGLGGARLLETWPEASAAFIGPADRKVVEHLLYRFGEAHPGVSYRTQEGIISYEPELREVGTPREHLPLPKFDFSGTEFLDYGFVRDLDRHNGATVVYNLDCALANRRCVFCARMPMGFGHRNPETFWREIASLARQRIRFFYHASDSVIRGSNQVRISRAFSDLVDAQPTSLKGAVIHRVFANAFEFYEPAARKLAEFGNVIVHVGFESAGKLDKVGKGKTKLSDNDRVLRLCQEYGLKLIASFVFGLPDETKVSMRQTEDYIVKILENYGCMNEGGVIKHLEASPLMILPGAPAANNLWHALGLPRSGALSPLELDFKLASEEYFRRFCSISRDDILETLERVSQRAGGYLDVKGVTNQEAADLQLSSDFCKILDH